MEQKCKELTRIDGYSMEHYFLKLHIIILMVAFAFLIGQLLAGPVIFTTSNDIIPFALWAISLTYVIAIFAMSFSLYNLPFYQKCRFYMIPANEVFKYHMKSVFSPKNIIVILGGTLLLGGLYYLISDGTSFSGTLSIVYLLLYSPSLVSVSFLHGTLVEEKYYSAKIVILIASIMGFTIFFFVLTVIGSLFSIIIILLIDIISIVLVNQYSLSRERRMEV